MRPQKMSDEKRIISEMRTNLDIFTANVEGGLERNAMGSYGFQDERLAFECKMDTISDFVVPCTTYDIALH